MYESRAITSDNTKDIKLGYPSLLSHSVFANMSSGEMWDYLLRPENRAQSSEYSSVFSYMSNMLTSEGMNTGPIREEMELKVYRLYILVINTVMSLFSSPLGLLRTGTKDYGCLMEVLHCIWMSDVFTIGVAR